MATRTIRISWSRALCIIVLLVGFLLPALLRPAWFPSDDAYFYLQIARNIEAGKGSTFNGITPTNGYHPLWMVICVALACISGGSRETLVLLSIVTQQMLFLACIHILYLVGKKLDMHYWWLSVPLLGTVMLSLGLYGSEAHLTLLLLLLLLYTFVRWEEHPMNTEKALIGVSGCLLFLSRLDTLFLTGVLFSYVLLKRTTTKDRFATLLLLGIPFVAIAAPYLFYNQLTFGHITPISGDIKSTFPNPIHTPGQLGLFGGISVLGGAIGLGFRRIYRNHNLRSAIWILSVGTLLHACYILLFTHHLTNWAWYYLPGLLNISLLLDIVADRWVGNRGE